MGYSWKSKRMLESVREHGLRGPAANGEFSFWCPFCEERGYWTNELFKGTLRISGTAKVRNGIDTEREEIELSPEQGVFHCWRCGVFGVADLSWILTAEIGAALPEPDTRPIDLGPPEGFELLDPDRVEHAAAVNYLRGGRAFDLLDRAIAVGAGMCRSGWFAGRVVIPHMEKGKWKGFVARTLFDKDPPYLTPRGMDRRRMLWGLEDLDKSKPTWIVEGVFDALPLRPRALATYGTGITEEQLDLIAENLERAVVCLDGDSWKKARMVASQLRMRGVSTAWAKLPAGADPGNLGWNVRRYVVSG